MHPDSAPFSGPIQSVQLVSFLWLIPLFPFLGAVVNALFGLRLQRRYDPVTHKRVEHTPFRPNSNIAIGAMTLSFLVAVYAFVKLWSSAPEERFLLDHVWPMARLGALDMDFALAVDPLSAVMVLIITGVGTLIHVYATEYMATEPAYWRFFCYLNLFVFSMLLLVLGDNFFVMFFGWEGVGLCSYLLIGFWYQDYRKATAGMKAFVANRFGDWGFITGLMILFWGLGTLLNGGHVPHGEIRGAGEAAWEGPYADYHSAQNAEGFVLSNRLVPVVVTAAEEAGEHGAAHGEHASPQGEHAPPQGEHAPSGAATLTVTAMAGAAVWIDPPGGRPEGEPTVRTPFQRRELAAGEHRVFVQPTRAHRPFEVSLVAAAGQQLVLAPVGPTITFRALRDQLGLRPPGVEHATLRDTLLNRSLFGLGLLTLACICFFIGATGKSAQIPLYVWLPDAMAGPTPVSALIHAATMVTAGVYMVARLSFLFGLSPVACAVVAVTGAATALFAATMGFYQYDLKKVLAYSTVSQLGFMFIGVGVGAYWAGVFHLMTHAFFKACLFLCSGSVIHTMHHFYHSEADTQDMRNMGGLGKVMPKTRLSYLLACIAITAAPPGLAGFWSKDEILLQAFISANLGNDWLGQFVWALGLMAALCTSFYMWRSYYLTFSGELPETIAKKAAASPDGQLESPPAIVYVLLTLAALSVLGGFVGAAPLLALVGVHAPPFEAWLEPAITRPLHVAQHPSHALEYGLMAASVVGAALSWFIAKTFYENAAGDPAKQARLAKLKQQNLQLWTTLHNKYYVDEIYRATVVEAALRLRMLLAGTDRWVVDGLVNFAGVLGKFAAGLTGLLDRYVVDGLVNVVAEGTLAGGQWVRRQQTGQIQTYVLFALGGVVALAFLQYVVAS